MRWRFDISGRQIILIGSWRENTLQWIGLLFSLCILLYGWLIKLVRAFRGTTCWDDLSCICRCILRRFHFFLIISNAHSKWIMLVVWATLIIKVVKLGWPLIRLEFRRPVTVASPLVLALSFWIWSFTILPIMFNIIGSVYLLHIEICFRALIVENLIDEIDFLIKIYLCWNAFSFNNIWFWIICNFIVRFCNIIC